VIENCPSVSVIVPTGDRVDTIEDCLQSVAWADELIVVDSFSTDGTLDIAQRYADRILQHEYINSAIQKNWAIPQAAHEWVMIVDTDERVTPALRQEIEQVLSAGGDEVGYRMPRVNYLLGKPLRHTGYYPDYQIRLFQRDLARYEPRQVHAHVLLEGPCGTLQSPLIHYAHRSIDQTLQNLLVLMTTWEAKEREQSDQYGGPLWVNLTLRPLGVFFHRYVRQGGWRDGYAGLVASAVWAIYVAVTYMKVWERRLDLPEQWWAEHWNRLREKEPNDL
jgi:glycosyltransferase involved in cell wall biosynthesis